MRLNLWLTIFGVLSLFSFSGIFSSSLSDVNADGQTCADFGDGPVVITGEGKACLNGGQNTNYECPTGFGYLLGQASSLANPAYWLGAASGTGVEQASIDRCEEDLQTNLATAYLNCVASCQEAQNVGLQCVANPTTSVTACTASCNLESGIGVSFKGIGIGITDYRCKADGSATFQCDCVGAGTGTGTIGGQGTGE